MPSTSSFLIRRATPSDAAALAELAACTFAETFAADNKPEDIESHLRSAYGLAQQTAEIEDPEVITLLALHDGLLAGFAQVRRKGAPDCVTVEFPAELHRFYVVRSQHGKGLASDLMQAARSAARELGGVHLWLGVWERNARAISFYRKAGFTAVGSHVFMVGSDPQTDLVLVSPPLEPQDTAT
jgi:GNAT superfamily N-acetyltransferase